MARPGTTAPDSCPVCESREIRAGGIFSLPGFIRCRNCGLHYRKDLDSILQPNQVYESDSSSVQRLIEEEPLRKSYYRSQADRIESVVDFRGSLLEIGCGCGGLLAELASRGWSVEGIEPSPFLSAVAEKQIGNRGIIHKKGFMEDAGSHCSRTYQVVIAIDVLEHLVAPQVFIQQVSGMLPRDGILILQTPNVKSLRRFIQGAGWEQYRPDEHPLLYSSKALRHILTRAGFIMLHMKTISGTAVESNGRSGWLRGVQKVLNSLHGGNTLWVACRKAAI